MDFFLADTGLSPEELGRLTGKLVVAALAIVLLVAGFKAAVRAFAVRTVWSFIGAFFIGTFSLLFALGLLVSLVVKIPGSSSSSQGERILNGRVLPYTLTVTPEWTVQEKPLGADHDMTVAFRDSYVSVIAEEGFLGSSEKVVQLSRDQLEGKVTDVEWGEVVPIQVDGRSWLQYTAKLRANNIPIGYVFYVYSGQEGTFQIIGWTTQRKFDRSLSSLRAVMNTFKFPAKEAVKPAGGELTDNDSSMESSRNSNAARITGGSAPGSAKQQTLRGRVLPYQLTIPSDWTVMKEPVGPDHDLSVFFKNSYVSIIAEEVSLGSSEKLAQIVREQLKKNVTDILWSQPKPMELDGRSWLQYTVKCRIEGVPVGYVFYVYSGQEGTFQILGWTSENLFDRDERLIRQVMNTFKF